MNCRYSCVHWVIGVEIKSNVRRDNVENLVRMLMKGKNRKEMKMKTIELKKKAEEATASGGSSYLNVKRIV
ncbi:hypothetical protein GIB67_037564 [Kingdonia uniflora]|uniref:Uncharacterized protein n=1 Tax=Kingdonia uniflora TaxID=39325 RepID=A0A7J7LSA0_9MAGN|nr:hypothetical protein GIB67_037564 [Kingdonia uniflora]